MYLTSSGNEKDDYPSVSPNLDFMDKNTLPSNASLLDDQMRKEIQER